jgi:hypothetical protein
LPDHEQRLVELHRRTVVEENHREHAGGGRGDRRIKLHHLDQAQRITLGHALALFDKRRLLRCGTAIEGADHRHAHADVPLGQRELGAGARDTAGT